MDVEEILISLRFEANNFISLYMHYTTAGKKMFMHRDVLHLFLKQKRDAPATMTLVITYLDVRGFFICPQENILCLIRAADAYVRNYHNLASFNANYFHRHASAPLMKFTFETWNKTKSSFLPCAVSIYEESANKKNHLFFHVPND